MSIEKENSRGGFWGALGELGEKKETEKTKRKRIESKGKQLERELRP